VVGYAAAIRPGQWIMASGEWVDDRTHGQQFKARFLRTSAPISADGILANHGKASTFSMG
jgi:exodeoxyribonuclease V alpha subunit